MQPDGAAYILLVNSMQGQQCFESNEEERQAVEALVTGGRGGLPLRDSVKDGWSDFGMNIGSILTVD